jgi:Pyridoxamine 5'-phosphate oxidase
MATWSEFRQAEPAFAERVWALFAAQKHMTLATLRRDGSPRISGTELHMEDGELYLDMMPDSLKAQDLRRDPRFAVHSPTFDAPEDDQSAWKGDAKIAGVVVDVPRDEYAHFGVDIREVVLTSLSRPPDYLIVEAWHPARGLERHERR